MKSESFLADQDLAGLYQCIHLSNIGDILVHLCQNFAQPRFPLLRHLDLLDVTHCRTQSSYFMSLEIHAAERLLMLIYYINLTGNERVTLSNNSHFVRKILIITVISQPRALIVWITKWKESPLMHLKKISLSAA